MGAAEQSNINYQAIEIERLTEIQKSITERLTQVKETGLGESLRRSILNQVVAGNYERAKQNLDEYFESRYQYPNFQSRADRFRKHAKELIAAIETKRTFHGLGGMPLAKQQELYEKVVNHFEELKQHLKSIERMDKEVRLEDIRSTTWFVKSIFNSLFFLFGLALSIDFMGGLASSFNIVLDAVATDAANWLLKVLSGA